MGDEDRYGWMREKEADGDVSCLAAERVLMSLVLSCKSNGIMAYLPFS